MKTKEVIRQARKIAERFRIAKGGQFRLRSVDPRDTGGLRAEDKPRAREALATGVAALTELQNKLYAHNRWALLLIFQAMDAAGKDGVIKHVMSGVNPQGCQVVPFKSPSSEELDHDYLWRCVKCLPRRGHIGIFNRSYYEETLAVRVHPEFLGRQRLPARCVHKRIWEERFQDIRCFERYLSHNGVMVRKFYLHMSKKEQKRRFLERLQNPDKHWKFSSADMIERGSWEDYQDAYEEMIRKTATGESPWFVIPADNKWFSRVVVAAAIIDALAEMKLAYPEVDAAQRKQMAAAERSLLRK